jgi:tetratricopeptide (TPR) repeat protein
MKNSISRDGTERSGVTLLPFVKGAFKNYKGLLEAYLTAARPPFLFITIWLLGMSELVGRIEMTYFSIQRIQLASWILIWTVILLGGVISGYLAYWVGGALYHVRVRLSGGTRNFNVSRNLFLYNGLPLYLAMILSEVANTFVYGNSYFTEPTSVLLDLALLGLFLAGVISTISLSYRGVCLLQETRRIPSILFFIVFPAIFYSWIFGGLVQEFSYQHIDGRNPKERAIQFMFTGQYEKAEELLVRALKTKGKDHPEESMDLYTHLGEIYEHEGLHQKALDSYEKALSLSKAESSSYYSMLAKISILNGDIHEATANFEKSLELNPDDYYAHHELGMIFLGLVDSEVKDYDRALSHNKKAFQLKEDPFSKQSLAINYYLLNRYPEALPLFESLNTLSSKNALAKYCLGRIYYSRNEPAKAKIFLKEALALDPSLPTADIGYLLDD